MLQQQPLRRCPRVMEEECGRPCHMMPQRRPRATAVSLSRIVWMSIVWAAVVKSADAGVRRRYLSTTSIEALELIQVGTNAVVASLLSSDNMVIWIDPEERYTINAVVGGADAAVESVRFHYSNNADTNSTKTHTENVAPYALCGDAGGLDYFLPCEALVGEGVVHTVTATPYAENGGQGLAGASKSTTFTLMSEVESSQPPSFAVDSLELMEVGSNRVVATLSANHSTVTIDQNKRYNIQATTTASNVKAVQSVQFSFNHDPVLHTENVAPFALCGDANGQYFACDDILVPDIVHTVTATPYSETGMAGGAQTVSFTLTTATVPTSMPPGTVGPPSETTVEGSTSSCRIPKFVGTWKRPELYPITAAEAQGAVIDGKDLIIVSGFTEGFGQATHKNFALNLTDPNASWRPIADLPVRDGITHGAFTVVGSKFYMCGGYQGGHPGPHIPTCLVYDHTLDAWKFMEPLPAGRAGGGMVYSSEMNALIFSAGAERPSGAQYEDYQHTWMYRFDHPEAGWVEKADIPYLTNHMSSTTAIDETGKERHFFLAGQLGGDEHSGNLDNSYEYDIESESWIERRSMPFTRGHASSSTNAVNCGFLIAGGSSNEFGKTGDVSFYDTSSNTWTRIGDLPNKLNTPVCGIDMVGGWYYCFTGWAAAKFATKIKIEL